MCVLAVNANHLVREEQRNICVHRSANLVSKGDGPCSTCPGLAREIHKHRVTFLEALYVVRDAQLRLNPLIICGLLLPSTRDAAESPLFSVLVKPLARSRDAASCFAWL